MDIVNWIRDHKVRNNINRMSDDYTKYCKYGEYNKTFSYGKRYIDINGVREKLKELEDVESTKYEKDVKRIVTDAVEKEVEVYNNFHKWRQRSDKLKRYTMILFGIWIFCKLPLPISIKTVASFIGPLCFLIGLIMLVIAIVITKIRNNRKKAYSEFESSILNQINKCTAQFSNICIAYYKDIDNLYLNSLTPEQRQIVMMQREMDRRDREHQKEIESMQRSMQNMAHEFGRAMENLSKGMSEAQDRTANELRKIRENQEDRYRY